LDWNEVDLGEQFQIISSGNALENSRQKLKCQKHDTGKNIAIPRPDFYSEQIMHIINPLCSSKFIYETDITVL
jgi:hypothetical protein